MGLNVRRAMYKCLQQNKRTSPVLLSSLLPTTYKGSLNRHQINLRAVRLWFVLQDTSNLPKSACRTRHAQAHVVPGLVWTGAFALASGSSCSCQPRPRELLCPEWPLGTQNKRQLMNINSADLES